MKPDAAAPGVVDRVGQEVVDVDDRHREHPAPRRPPPGTEGEYGHHSRQGSVKDEMDYGAGVHGFFRSHREPMIMSRRDPTGSLKDR